MKKTKRFLAMLLTLILGAGEFASTDISILAAGDEQTDTGSDAVTDDEAKEVGIGTKFYMGERLPDTDKLFAVEYYIPGYGLYLTDKTTLTSAILPEPVAEHESISYYPGHNYEILYCNLEDITPVRFHDTMYGEY